VGTKYRHFPNWIKPEVEEFKMRGLGDYPKAIRAEFRELIGRAHERELAAALEGLATHFDAWRQGKLDAFDLNQLVLEYHHGPSREIWKRYEDGSPASALALAVARDVIREDEVSPEAWAHIEELVQSIRAWREQSDEPEEAEELDW
jgi:hypothetical protein